MSGVNGWVLPTGMAAEVFLAQIIEQLPHAMFVKDREFRYVVVNRALVRMDADAEHIVGKTDYDFLPEARAALYRSKDMEVFSTASEVAQAAEPLIAADGSTQVIATLKVPLRDASGEVTHLIGIISDITHLKAVEEDLRMSSELLERRVAERTSALALAQDDLVRKERLAILGRLAGGVAHQVRNPLAAIKNAAYVLHRRMREILPAHFANDGAKDVAHALEIIHDEVQRANQIITDLLDYARVRAPVRRPTSIDDLIDHALRGQAIPGNITVARRVPDLPSIAVDPDQLQGALFNVLRNAIEAMPDGGTLTIETALRDADVVVTIADTGDGIATDVLPRLFEPLITTKLLGLGLGLVTARTLIEGQGGSIACVRSDASGATFEIRLPSAPAST